MAQIEAKEKPKQDEPSVQDSAEETREALREIFCNGLLFKNPVLIGAIGLCPVVAAGTSLKNGVALSLILAGLLIPVCVLFSVIGSKIPVWLRPSVILILAAALYIPVSLLTEACLPGSIASLGIYAPLMAANAIITSRTKNFSVRHVYYASFVDAVSCSAGFAVVICIASAIREMMISGSLWDKSLPFLNGGNERTQFVFMGFIILGFLSAIAQAIRNYHEKRKAKRRELGQ